MIQFLSATGSASMTETLFTLLPMILIIVFMFILIYLPQKRQDKKDAAMRSSIEIGDKVSTIGGIVGIVCAIADKDDTIVLETGSDRTKIRFRRSAIASVEKLDVGGKDTTPVKK
ncbi:MAG: preprotein translocase subunit YajC [Subdoligranulum variabile]|uniref:preprotein translocase subunit YajC n=1 Tax=Gemmiger sp. TaxID=2049027 RepID=UPI0025D16609|nr:preprotein translocase subunit YajC [Gemmiger sp.]MBD8952485.1 preprotein translocase subunit YajC [Subdoligranulum sp.]MCI6141904.1 preprotein translocase subunit YajC [Subdoligranulum variabile]MCI6385474.1 preprotein translocase subunit YajC [Subdoligranulum variabile]MCI7642668.1 preprotein translocase subunit YajC [Subdoligranulum variabile]MDD6423961.1 preprotein translocase subunit YajC [Subdoligranulum variabile]